VTLRLDKWLWYARFFKSRTRAATFLTSGKLRLNDHHITKSHQQIRAGDVLTFPLGDYVRVIEILATGTRRGPASEAVQLYNDLAPPQPQNRNSGQGQGTAPREPGSGRPTKTQRRAIDRLHGRD
jgi:ribosome-associated heat shock protein Hsp15